jgi:hypothetical protein
MKTTAPLEFHIRLGEKTHVLTQKDIRDYADLFCLDKYAEGRYSSMFVLNMILYEKLHGINPFQIVDEIRAIEGESGITKTKAASEFTKPPLSGLWHKHFFSARFMPKNILNQLGNGKLKAIVEEVLDPENSPVVTEEMINELSHRVTLETFESRATKGKLTGEWIIFARHDGQNYYLCLATHDTGDQKIYDNIKAGCFGEFPFLASVLA